MSFSLKVNIISDVHVDIEREKPDFQVNAMHVLETVKDMQARILNRAVWAAALFFLCGELIECVMSYKVIAYPIYLQIKI